MHKFLFCNKLLYSSTCFERCCAHHQEVKLHYTTSGIFTLCRWPSGAQVERGLLTVRPPTQCDDNGCCIMQFDLLMMRTTALETVEEYNKLITKQEFVYIIIKPTICTWCLFVLKSFTLKKLFTLIKTLKLITPTCFGPTEPSSGSTSILAKVTTDR
jgi:hypothetical protein